MTKSEELEKLKDIIVDSFEKLEVKDYLNFSFRNILPIGELKIKYSQITESINISQDYSMDLISMSSSEAKMPYGKKANDLIQNSLDFSAQVAKKYIFKNFEKELRNVDILCYDDVYTDTLIDAGLQDIADELEEKYKQNLSKNNNWCGVVNCHIYQTKNSDYELLYGVDILGDMYKTLNRDKKIRIADCSKLFLPQEFESSCERILRDTVFDMISYVCGNF